MPDITFLRTVTDTELAALNRYAAAKGHADVDTLLQTYFTKLLSEATTHFQTALKSLLPAAWAKATDAEKVALIQQLQSISQRP